MLFLSPPAQIAPPPTVAKVDLARYMGDWFEIARLPNPFQRKCERTTARYTLTGDGRFRVLNACLTPGGQLKEATGRARVVDVNTGSKIEVTFFWPFYGDYWILDLDPEYRWALVGTPDRKYLWVISRTERMEPGTLDALLGKARSLGYDLAPLIRSGV
jgi:apolipoprotein D and lipocalin family protein